MSVYQRTKEKKEEINCFCSFKDSSIAYLIKNLVFDNFIQFLYISYFLKGTGKYDIYYNGSYLEVVIF